jgi:hypothetical protein
LRGQEQVWEDSGGYGIVYTVKPNVLPRRIRIDPAQMFSMFRWRGPGVVGENVVIDDFGPGLILA